MSPTNRRLSMHVIRIVVFAASFVSIRSACHADVLNFFMTIDGIQETPANNTTGAGTGTATFDTATSVLSWNISFSDLTSVETAAHFHGPARQCEAGDVVIPLPLGSPKVGSKAVTALQAAEIMNGLWYVNIHSANNPGGEIRGQLVPLPLADPLPGQIAAGAIHLRLETVATGLVGPNWGINAPGDSSRLFVTDQTGNLFAINLNDGTKSVFLDTSSLLVAIGIGGPGSYDERGLLGVAFHPSYQTNGLLYTYTSEPANAPSDFSTMPVGVAPNCQSVIREWHVPNQTNPESVVDPASTRVLMRIDKPQFNHNAGALNFGPDGMLYISLGDGGSGDDEDGQPFIGPDPTIGHGCKGNGQNTMAVLGKILRIDPTGNNSANGHYGIPANNPFVGHAGFLPEIFAYGFRNPFRFSFDSVSGALYVGDVGQNKVEEVDVVIPGGNYGWHIKEGSFFFEPNGKGDGYVVATHQFSPRDLIDPIAQYDHDEGIAIIGGFVYRGTHIAPLRGKYVFGELAKTFASDGRLFYLDGGQIREFQFVGQSSFGLFLLGFGQDANGELYALANANGVTGGTTGVVLRITTKTADIDSNGVVDVNDLLAVIANWGPCPPSPTICPADLISAPGAERMVNVDDLLLVINNWG